MDEKQKEISKFRMALAKSNGYAEIKRPGFIDYIDKATGRQIAMVRKYQDGRDSDYVVFE